MQFIYAHDLKSQFSVYGHFYDLEINGITFKCRSVLEIVAKSSGFASDSNPCAVVVMMNPGSSKPENCAYIPKKYTARQIASGQLEKDIIPARPDNAQYQIMRLMLLQGWKHVRILNLSDLRNGNSRQFSIEFQKASSLDATNLHSLTNKQRQRELLDYCSQSKTLIAAWGANKVLKEAATEFLNQFKQVEGIQLLNPWYRYPSPRYKNQKLDWLKMMNEQLKHKKTSQGILQSCAPALNVDGSHSIYAVI
jgi:hypothetical protein